MSESPEAILHELQEAIRTAVDSQLAAWSALNALHVLVDEDVEINDVDDIIQGAAGGVCGAYEIPEEGMQEIVKLLQELKEQL